MKTAIIYVSLHHGNTRKLLEAIKARHEVDLIDAIKDKDADLEGYERIGLASGIAYGNFYPQMISYMKEKLPMDKEIFFIYTYGAKRSSYTRQAREVAKERNAVILGEYGCLGFDTFGPFKLVGGIAKGHPDEKEIAAAVSFYESL